MESHPVLTWLAPVHPSAVKGILTSSDSPCAPQALNQNCPHHYTPWNTLTGHLPHSECHSTGPGSPCPPWSERRELFPPATGSCLLSQSGLCYTWLTFALVKFCDIKAAQQVNMQLDTVLWPQCDLNSPPASTQVPKENAVHTPKAPAPCLLLT